MSNLIAIIPDPHYFSGDKRKEIISETPDGLAREAREFITLSGYGSRDIGSLFNVYRDGNIVGTLRYNGKFDWRDVAYAS